MQPPRGLESFFAALREAKILVGPREVLRVYEVLGRIDEIDQNQLRALLAAILVKSAEERQRFDELYRSFFQVQEIVPLDDGPATPDPPAPASKKLGAEEVPLTRSLERRTILTIAVTVAVVAGGALALWQWRGHGSATAALDAGLSEDASAALAAPNQAFDSGLDADKPVEMADGGVADGAANAPKKPNAQVAAVVVETPKAEPDQRSFTTLVPTLEVEAQSFWSNYPGRTALFGAGSFIAAVAAWLFARRRRILPPRAPAPSRQGPAELPLWAPVPRDLELLDLRSEDALVWGIGKFITDDVTTELDVEQTVLATVAAGGRPELRFQRRGRHRQVCIWIDESSEDPTIERIGRELSLALARVGLEVEVARYWAIPDKLVRNNGSVFSPAVVEEELAFAIIAILTDGKALSMRHSGADRRLGIGKFLRMLARLPRLAFVDFGEGPGRASRVANAYGITTVRPDEAAAFLALGRKPDVRDAPPRKLTGDMTAWAAACAFGMQPIDEEAGYAIRRALGLSVSAWAWPMVRRSGTVAGDLIDWTPGKRAELIDWLRRAEGTPEGKGVAPASLLGKTISFWKQRLDAEAAARAKDDAKTPWIGTSMQRSHKIERAFIDLWDRPEDAVRFLYSFVGTDAETLVQEKLRHYGPLEAEGFEGLVILPWKFEDLSEPVRAMFERIGFGEDTWASEPRREGDLVERRGRLWIGLGLACGLGTGALIAGINWWRSATFPCVVESVEGCGGWCVERENTDGTRQVLGGLVGFWRRTTAGRTDRPKLVFSDQQVPCTEITPDGWVLMRCGDELPPAKPERVADPRRSVYLVLGDPQDELVVSMARYVLGHKVTDIVVLAKPPLSGNIEEWFPILDQDKHDRWVVLRPQGISLGVPFDASQVDLHEFEYDLPSATRKIGLRDKPRQAWWNGEGDKVGALSSATSYYEIDATNKGQQKWISQMPSRIKSEGGKRISSVGVRDVRFDPGELTFRNLDGEYPWMAWNFKGDQVVFSSRDGSVEIAGEGVIGDRAPLSILQDQLASPVVWNQEGTRFVGITKGGSIVRWFVPGGFTSTMFNELMSQKPLSLAWSINGDLFIVGTESGVRALNRYELFIEQPQISQPISAIVGPVASMYLFVSAATGKAVMATSMQTQQGGLSLKPKREMRALGGSFSPDGRYLATVHEGGKIRVATTDDDVTINEFGCDTREAPVWSPKGDRLLAICGDKLVDTPVFPAVFSLRTAGGKCISSATLTDIFGMRTSEATFMAALCDPQ